MVATATPVAWDQAIAMQAYRQTAARISRWWDAADVFDKPSLSRADIKRADAAIQAAFRQHDLPTLRASLARWELAITGASR